MPGWRGDMISRLQALTPLAALIAAILAWLAKLRWSKEFAAAKDAEIAALKTQVSNLTNVHSELVKAKDAEIAAFKTQISSLTSNYADLVKEKEAHIVILERDIKSLQDLNFMKIKEYF